MDPYIIASIIIIITIAIGTLLVKHIYNHRTQEPTIDIGFDLPDGVDLNDALGGILK